MSTDNAELLRATYAAFNRDDYAAMLELLGEDSEILRAGGLGVIRGREAIGEFLAPDAFEYQRGEIIELRENASRVLVTLDWRLRGKGSGIEMQAKVFHVWTVNAGKLRRLEIYFDEAEALKAAGLQE
jgi:ketosteroid isomerase-like protein